MNITLDVGRRTQMFVRERTFEAKDEAKVRRWLKETQDAGVVQVQGFTLRSIEWIPDQTVGDI
jgi:hypothetical protein